MSDITNEMDFTEAGYRGAYGEHDATKENNGITSFAVKSTFPDWVPSDLRDSELFDKVFGSLEIGKIQFPTGNRTRQRELYQIIFDELDARLVVDTKAIRQEIMKSYETKNNNKAVAKTQNNKSVKGGKKPPKESAKIKTIGTKTVERQSIIKNAVEEANRTIRDAGKAGLDMTTQMGTTFVEQRKISAEILAERGFDDTLALAREASDGELGSMNVSRDALYEILSKNAIKDGQFNKYRDDLEELSLRTGQEGSVYAQGLSLHRMATANDPFRRIAQLKKAIIENEKKARGTVFTKEVDDLYAKIREATTEEDVNKIINDNLC